MPFIDPTEFERAKGLAASGWRRSGNAAVAEAFLMLDLGRCGFGMTHTARTCWGIAGGMRLGLAFGIETGSYERSFVIPSRE